MRLVGHSGLGLSLPGLGRFGLRLRLARFGRVSRVGRRHVSLRILRRVTRLRIAGPRLTRLWLFLRVQLSIPLPFQQLLQHLILSRPLWTRLRLRGLWGRVLRLGLVRLPSLGRRTGIRPLLRLSRRRGTGLRLSGLRLPGLLRVRLRLPLWRGILLWLALGRRVWLLLPRLRLGVLRLTLLSLSGLRLPRLRLTRLRVAVHRVALFWHRLRGIGSLIRHWHRLSPRRVVPYRVHRGIRRLIRRILRLAIRTQLLRRIGGLLRLLDLVVRGLLLLLLVPLSLLRCHWVNHGDRDLRRPRHVPQPVGKRLKVVLGFQPERQRLPRLDRELLQVQQVLPARLRLERRGIKQQFLLGESLAVLLELHHD